MFEVPKKCLIVLHGCSQGAQRVLNRLSGAEGALSGFKVLYPCLNLQLFPSLFVISCMGISFVQLFGSRLEIMVSRVREPSVISSNSKNHVLF